MRGFHLVLVAGAALLYESHAWLGLPATLRVTSAHRQSALARRGLAPNAAARRGLEAPRAAGCLALRASDSGGAFDMSAFEAELQRRNEGAAGGGVERATGSDMDAEELRGLVTAKWGQPFDTKIVRRRDARNVMKFYLQVMWRHLHQQSFFLTEDEYMDQLGAVASLISEWCSPARLRAALAAAPPPELRAQHPRPRAGGSRTMFGSRSLRRSRSQASRLQPSSPPRPCFGEAPRLPPARERSGGAVCGRRAAGGAEFGRRALTAGRGAGRRLGAGRSRAQWRSRSR